MWRIKSMWQLEHAGLRAGFVTQTPPSPARRGTTLRRAAASLAAGPHPLPLHSPTPGSPPGNRPHPGMQNVHVQCVPAGAFAVSVLEEVDPPGRGRGPTSAPGGCVPQLPWPPPRSAAAGWPSAPVRRRRRRAAWSGCAPWWGCARGRRRGRRRGMRPGRRAAPPIALRVPPSPTPR